MKRLTSSICAGVLSLAMAATSFIPAHAAPLGITPSTPDVPLVQVQGPQDFRSRDRRAQREFRSQRPGIGNQRQAQRGGFHRRGDRYYYNGHRGYRDRRPGYRQHQGWWFPPAAFIAGAIIGGANRGPGVSTAHVRWCENRYRSYRASDNTFQPYNGPRRQCTSPYG